MTRTIHFHRFIQIKHSEITLCTCEVTQTAMEMREQALYTFSQYHTYQQ